MIFEDVGDLPRAGWYLESIATNVCLLLDQPWKAYYMYEWSFWIIVSIFFQVSHFFNGLFSEKNPMVKNTWMIVKWNLNAVPANGSEDIAYSNFRWIHVSWKAHVCNSQYKAYVIFDKSQTSRIIALSYRLYNTLYELKVVYIQVV